MSTAFVRRAFVFLGVLAVAGVTRQFVASQGAESELEQQRAREGDLEGKLARINQRIERRTLALREYAEGLTTLSEAATKFRQSDVWDPISVARVQRLWPDAPSDDERYAAEVVQCLRELAERQLSDVPALVRAETDFWQTFGRSPDPVG